MASNKMPMNPTPAGAPKIDTARDNRKTMGTFKLSSRSGTEFTQVTSTGGNGMSGTALPTPTGKVAPPTPGKEYRQVSS